MGSGEVYASGSSIVVFFKNAAPNTSYLVLPIKTEIIIPGMANKYGELLGALLDGLDFMTAPNLPDDLRCRKATSASRITCQAKVVSALPRSRVNTAP